MKAPINRVVTRLVAERQRVARDVVVLARKIARAQPADDEMDSILAMQSLWIRLGEIEQVFQILRGVPAEESGVWPSRARSKDAGDSTQAP